MKLARLTAIVGIVIATAVALYPRWDRTWQDRGTALDRRDVVRAFLFTGPPPPAPTPWQPMNVVCEPRWGESLGVWVLIVLPFLMLAQTFNWKPQEPPRRDGEAPYQP